MVGASSLNSSTSTTTLSIASANFGGTWSSASETSSSKRARVMSTGTGSIVPGCGRGRAAVAAAVVRGRARGVGLAGVVLDAAGDGHEAAAVLESGRDLAVDLGGAGVPALLLAQVPAEDELLGAEVGLAGVGVGGLVALGVQPGVLLGLVGVAVLEL